MRTSTLLIISLLALATLSTAQNFAAPRVFSFGNANAQQIALGDFNGDGLPDIVASYKAPAGKIAVLLSNGNGTFKAPLVSSGDSANPVAIAVGDLNGDGKLDVVVAESNKILGFKGFGPAITVMLGNGDGTFQTGQTYSLKNTPSAIVVGDFNNDGNLDVAISSISSGENILLGNGDGTLQPATSVSSQEADFLATADVNGDDKLDLIIAFGKRAYVALGNGDGTFQNPITSIVGRGTKGIALGDVNHDGKLDIVTVSHVTAYVSLGNGDGTFQTAVPYAAGSANAEVTLGDVNHDGNLDIVISSNAGPVATAALIMLLGKGDGTFNTPVSYYVSPGLQQALVADFDGDGNPDVVGLTGLNSAESYGDFNAVTLALGKGDGTFITAPSYDASGEWGLGLSADFNNDGIPDLAVPTLLGTTVLLGNGDGTFLPENSEGEDGIYSSVAAGDFNRDGNMDAASVNREINSLTVALGNGDGTFGPTSYYIAHAGPQFVATGDVNGDGILDLLAANVESNDLSVLLGKGDGTFGGATNYSIEQTRPVQFVLADLNGDHSLDVIVASFGRVAKGGLTVMLNNGDGTFGSPTQYAKGYFTAINVADLNGDGKLDIIAAAYDPPASISVFLGNGDGTFQKPIRISTNAGFGVGFSNLIVADYNGDGILDVAEATTYNDGYNYNGYVDIFLGNGDGTLQPPATFFAAVYLDQQGLYPPYLIGGDFNADGATDIASQNIQNGTVSVVLNTSGTFITSASSLNPSIFGQSVTFTAAVKGSINTATTPTGAVTFYDGTTSLGSATLIAGSATFSTSNLAVGSHTITSSYSGDTNFIHHTSAVLTQTVQTSPVPTFTWTATSSTSGSVLAGQSATYNFTATPTGASTFAMNVTFGCTAIATVNCSFNPSQIAAGSGPTTVQMTITTIGPNQTASQLRHRASQRMPLPWLPSTLPLVGIAMIGFARSRKSNRGAIAGIFVGLVLLGLMIACGGSGMTGGSSTEPPPAVVVTVNPGSPASLFPNDAADNWPLQTAQFAATVTNTTNQAVTWSASMGTIDANGLYTAPTVATGLPASVTITATSVADSTKSAQAAEPLNTATIPTPTGQPYTINVYAYEGNTQNNVGTTLAVQ